MVNAKALNAQGGLHQIALALKTVSTYVTSGAPPAQAFLNTDWVDNAGKAINLQDLVGYSNSQIVFNSVLASKSAAYHLKTK
ncbi:hypothetical protein [Pyxidicoccus caerfyrddinensis]|uniref:hypothetical protein n=1 Tax=Pyxidicoccus caerfyrddinensis TaxID=2709663 RepID=UPI0013DB1084|nr:hypothetical protein [Pyxidicoccus caerfyrddinensis]